MGKHFSRARNAKCPHCGLMFVEGRSFEWHVYMKHRERVPDPKDRVADPKQHTVEVAREVSRAAPREAEAEEEFD